VLPSGKFCNIQYLHLPATWIEELRSHAEWIPCLPAQASG